MKKRNSIVELITDPTKSFLSFFVVGTVIFTVISNGVSDLFWAMSGIWLQRRLGIDNPLVLKAIAIAVLIALILFIIYITPFSLWFKRRLFELFRGNEPLEIQTNAKPIEETFPGLIALMSPTPPDRQSPAERAILHHWNQGHKPHLRHCWLICTEQSEKAAQELHKKLIDMRISPELQLHWGESYQFENPKYPGKMLSLHVSEELMNDPICIQNLVNAIYADALSRYGLDESEMIADLTGGTKIMTVGMLLACTTATRRLEYISQLEQQRLMEIDIAYKLVSQKKK